MVSTHLKNMLVKLVIFPKVRGENKKYLKAPVQAPITDATRSRIHHQMHLLLGGVSCLALLSWWFSPKFLPGWDRWDRWSSFPGGHSKGRDKINSTNCLIYDAQGFLRVFPWKPLLKRSNHNFCEYVGSCLKTGSQWIMKVHRVPFIQINEYIIYPLI